MTWRLISNEELYAKLEEMHQLMRKHFSIIEKMETKMAQTLDDVIADITDLSSKEDGLITLTDGIKAQLDAVLAGNLTPAQQAKVDAIFAAVEARKTAIQTAIDTNTPAAKP